VRGPARRREGRAVTATAPITVFLVDDHEVVRVGLAQMLAGQPDIRVVGEASTAADALTRVRTVRPQVVLLDVRLPDRDGTAVCRELRATVTPPPACLILTSFTDDQPLFDAVEAGAAGFLLKEVSGSGLVEAVRIVAAGGSMLDPRMTPAVLERLRRGRSEPDERYATLTARERRILELIGEGMTNRQIGSQLHLAEKTVKNHVTMLLRKLGLQRRTEAAAYAARRRSA
jgi:DNA-binding NarL/FixJ family response regulator